MSARRADRVETGVFQVRADPAKLAQFCRCCKLVNPALGRFDRKPAQETRHRCAIACLSIAVALTFGRVFDRFGQNRRVICADDLRVSAF